MTAVFDKIVIHEKMNAVKINRYDEIVNEETYTHPQNYCSLYFIDDILADNYTANYPKQTFINTELAKMETYKIKPPFRFCRVFRLGNHHIYVRNRKDCIEKMNRLIESTPAGQSVINHVRESLRANNVFKPYEVVMSHKFTKRTLTRVYYTESYNQKKGFYIGNPEIKPIGDSRNDTYGIVCKANKTKTEICDKFVANDYGINFNSGFKNIVLQNEETGNPFNPFRDNTNPEVKSILEYMKITIYHDNKFQIENLGHFCTKSLTDLKEINKGWKEEIVQYVFHPDRVNRMCEKYGFGNPMTGEKGWDDLV
jgi:hypothetical protein